MSCRNTILVAVLAAVGAPIEPVNAVGASSAPRARVIGWAEAIDSVKDRPQLSGAVEALVDQARTEVKAGLVRRPYRLENVGKNRTWLDGRSNALEDEIRETFALAMSDFAACNHLANALPTVAAAARLTGDESLRDHVLAQLRETSGWSPLQRPGWTLYKPGNRLGADGKDGNWLATGLGVRAIVTTLEILGDQVDADLRGALKELLAVEIAGVVDDWKTKRPWFVRTSNAITNQWMLPTEGLVRACLYLGRDAHSDAYELGVKNLLEALSSHGNEGEFEEGIGYAGFTVASFLHTARAMAVAGDRRAIDHPFLARYPTWSVHHIQPGRMTVNCFDAGGAAIPRSDTGWRSALSLAVFAGGSEVANWALWEQFDGPTNDLYGLLTRVASASVKRTAPTPFKAYKRAPMVVWRDGWNDDANGVWVRGGHVLDGHDHQDRGHVNYIANGKPMLIEAGTPSYSNLDMPVHYESGAGHNVLQLGTFFPERPYPVQSTAVYPGWQRAHGIAPITVRRLDATGGEVVVDASRCYADAVRWVRQVEWTRTELSARDDVRLKHGEKDIVLFRWHLGTGQEAKIVNDRSSITIRWDGGEITLEGNEPLEVEAYKAPDATLTGAEDHQHTCLRVSSRFPVSALTTKMTIRPRDVDQARIQ